jgi:SAM-dependent methyltransferase
VIQVLAGGMHPRHETWVQTMLNAYSAGELATLANAFVSRSDFLKFGELMLHDLNRLRSTVDEEIWRTSLIPRLRREPFYACSQEDPISRRATIKPRGYAGDAHLIDFFYRTDSVAHELLTSTLAGQAIFNFWVNSPGARAVRDRKNYFTAQLVRAHLRNPKARILVLACGHFREGDIILENDGFTNAVITCLDQDPDSCAEVERRFANCGIDVLNKSVRAAIRLNDSRFDLIYAAGLYDYLDDQFAVYLNTHLKSILAPGGRLVVPNFLKSAPNRASMELLQDWFLIYRDEAEIRSLIPRDLQEHGTHGYFEDKNASIGYALFDRH